MPVFLVLAVVAMVVMAVASYQRNQARQQALVKFAAQHGLSFGPDAPSRIERNFNFHLFSLGDGRGTDNEMSGRWGDLPVVAADYWYYTESQNHKGGTSRSYSRFSVVMAEVPASVPAVRIEREGLLSRLADHLGMADIDLESEDFNLRFNLKSDDRAFACKLVDPRMMEWLLAAPSDLCVEVLERQVLIYRKALDPQELLTLFNSLSEFVERVPRLVWSEYGTSPT